LLGISVFWLGLSALGDGFAALVVPTRLASLGDPHRLATTIGLVTFVALLIGALVQPLAGAMSDAIRPAVGRRGVILGSALLVALTLALFGAASDVAAVLVAFILIQLAASVGQAAQQGYIPDLVDPGWRGRAAGLKGLADVGGAFVGFLVLGLLLSGGDVNPGLLFVAGIVIGTALLAAVLVREPRQSIDEARHDPPRYLSAFRLDRAADGPFIRAVIARFFFLLGIFAVGRFLLLFVAERLGIDPARAADETGWLLAVLTLVTALAAVPFGWLADRSGRVPTMIVGAFLAAVGAVLVGFAGTQTGILVFGAILGLGSAAFSSGNWALTTDLVRPGEAGRYMALANLGTAGAAAVAGLLGPVADAVRAVVPDAGLAPIFLLSATSIAIGGLVAAGLHDERAPAAAVESAGARLATAERTFR
jgi:MFS family permease